MEDNIPEGLQQFMGKIRRGEMKPVAKPIAKKVRGKKKEKTREERIKNLVKKIETGRLSNKKVLKKAQRIVIDMRNQPKVPINAGFKQPEKVRNLFYGKS